MTPPEFSSGTKAKNLSLLAAGAAGAYLCSEAFVPGAAPSTAQAVWDGRWLETIDR